MCTRKPSVHIAGCRSAQPREQQAPVDPVKRVPRRRRCGWRRPGVATSGRCHRASAGTCGQARRSRQLHRDLPPWADPPDQPHRNCRVRRGLPELPAAVFIAANSVLCSLRSATRVVGGQSVMTGQAGPEMPTRDRVQWRRSRLLWLMRTAGHVHVRYGCAGRALPGEVRRSRR